MAIRSHHLAIIGDSGINTVVPEGFWDQVKDAMIQRFSAGKFVEGLSEGISEVGRLLKQHFPYFPEDTNEQPDEISFGE